MIVVIDGDPHGNEYVARMMAEYRIATGTHGVKQWAGSVKRALPQAARPRSVIQARARGRRKALRNPLQDR
jgi:hypothetical protein